MTRNAGHTPAELASLLVDYFSTDDWETHPILNGAPAVAERWKVQYSVAKRAINMARVELREVHAIFLPVAHSYTGYRLVPTRDPISAYRGELPQIRDLNTRAEHTYDRLAYVLRRLETVRPIRAKQQERALRTAFDAFDAALENADGWITDQIETRGESA